ncbi:MAG: hypothetical protein ACR2QO_21190 [Acidimicrobiales bacterium]
MTEDGPEDSAPESSADLVLGRSRWPTVLVIGATVLAVFSLFSTWVKVQALETDAWVTLADEMLDDPEIQEALAVYIVDSLYAEVDVRTDLEAKLPDGFEGLAGPVAAGLRGPATTSVERLIASDEFEALWLAINRAAHENLVAILREETGPGLSTADGTVTLELGQLLALVGADIGLSDQALDRIPEDAGKITIFESDELDAAQQAVRVLDFMAWFTFVLVVGLYAAAVYVAAPDRRLVTLRNVGLSLMVGSAVGLIIRLISVRTTVELVVGDPGSRPIALVAGYVATGAIRQMAWSGIIYGLIVAAFATLLGERRWAKATRRVLAPALNSSVGVVVGGTILVLLLLLWWSPGRVFDGLVTGIAFVILVIAAVAALRRATLREFPTETMGDVATSASIAMSSLAPSRRAAEPDATVAQQLGALRVLHDSGDLAHDEYAKAKQRVLDGG